MMYGSDILIAGITTFVIVGGYLIMRLLRPPKK